MLSHGFVVLNLGGACKYRRGQLGVCRMMLVVAQFALQRVWQGDEVLGPFELLCWPPEVELCIPKLDC